MDMITMTPTAALRSRSESSFVVPGAVRASWHLGVDLPSLSTRIVEQTRDGQPIVTRNASTTAKPAAPPRGVPR